MIREAITLHPPGNGLPNKLHIALAGHPLFPLSFPGKRCGCFARAFFFRAFKPWPCRVTINSLSSSYLHKSSARRVSTRSPVRDIQSYEAQYGESSTILHTVGCKTGSIPDSLLFSKPTTGSSGVREKATLKKISTLVNLVEPLINLADFIPFQVFSIPAGTGAEITGWGWLYQYAHHIRREI